MLSDTHYPQDSGREHLGCLWMRNPSCGSGGEAETVPGVLKGTAIGKMHDTGQTAAQYSSAPGEPCSHKATTQPPQAEVYDTHHGCQAGPAAVHPRLQTALSKAGAQASMSADDTRMYTMLDGILVCSYRNLRLPPPRHPSNRVLVSWGPIPGWLYQYGPLFSLSLPRDRTEGKALCHIHMSQDSLENPRMVTKERAGVCSSQGCPAHYLSCLTRHTSLSDTG